MMGVFFGKCVGFLYEIGVSGNSLRYLRQRDNYRIIAFARFDHLALSAGFHLLKGLVFLFEV